MGGGEALGWMAAIASMLAFGSFGVPIKSDAANSVNVDPLVFQSYKSFMCFATSWLVLLTGKVPFSYTPWGIVSCMFWVPGGVATVFAIRNAGLAIAIGIGSSSIVLVSFVWGIFIFQENIHSRFWASVAIAMMMTGIFGMSYYSSPSSSSANQQQAQQLIMNGSSNHGAEFVSMAASDGNNDVDDDDDDESPRAPQQQKRQQRRHPKGYEGIDLQTLNPSPSAQTESSTTTQNELDSLEDPSMALEVDNNNNSSNRGVSAEEPAEQFEEEYTERQQQQHSTTTTTTEALDPLEIFIHIGGIPLTRRQVGIAGALFNGIWGGSIMAPMKWCHDSTSGVGYLISFGIGAAIVTTALWILRLINNVMHYNGNVRQAYYALPSFHLPIMWCAGGTSGLLWSIGNFFSLISVYYLGEGVGYSVVQAGMLVSGLWGIFYFHEIRGSQTIAKWLASACVTICGIILLSYEHHKSEE